MLHNTHKLRKSISGLSYLSLSALGGGEGAHPRLQRLNTQELGCQPLNPEKESLS